MLAATLLAALLAAAAAVLLTTGRADRAGFSEMMRMERARFMAEALISDAVVELDAGLPLPLDGQPAQLKDPASSGSLTMQDTSGLLDLNAADETQLGAFLVGMGLNPGRAQQLADRIADWRDQDDTKRLLGAEGPDYQAAGLPAPANGPFEVETQLETVLGVSPDLAACLEPYLTVFSGSNAIDVAVAPPPLKRIKDLATTSGSGSLLGSPIGHVIVVTARAPLSVSAALQLKEWVRLTGDGRKPVMIHRAQIQMVANPSAAPTPTCAAPAAGPRAA